jgi:hypothetical protein
MHRKTYQRAPEIVPVSLYGSTESQFLCPCLSWAIPKQSMLELQK